MRFVYKAPLTEEMTCVETQLICTSNSINGPDKPFGWDWDDDINW